MKQDGERVVESFLPGDLIVKLSGGSLAIRSEPLRELFEHLLLSWVRPPASSDPEIQTETDRVVDHAIRQLVESASAHYKENLPALLNEMLDFATGLAAGLALQQAQDEGMVNFPSAKMRKDLIQMVLGRAQMNEALSRLAGRAGRKSKVDRDREARAFRDKRTDDLIAEGQPQKRAVSRAKKETMERFGYKEKKTYSNAMNRGKKLSP